MNLSRVRLLADNGDHYVLHDGAAEFRVAKSGLSDAMHEKIQGFAKGGKVEGKVPPLPQPKDRTHVDVKLGDVKLTPESHKETPTERGQRKWDEYEEETDGPPSTAKPTPKPQPEEGMLSRAGRAVGDFARRATAGVAGMAEGGGVDAMPERRDAGPVVFVPAGDGGLRPVPVSQVAQAYHSYSPPQQAPTQAPAPQPAAGPSPDAVAAARTAITTTAPAGAQALGRLADEPQARADATADFQRAEASKLTTLRPREEAAAPPPAEAPVQPPRPQAGQRAAAPDYGVADMSASVAGEQAALRAKGEAEAAQAAQQAKVLGAVESQLQANALGEKQRREQARQEAQQLGAQRQALADEMKRVDTGVRTGRYWASKSTGSKILGAIGLALGAIGAGRDGVNRAALLMGQAIDRDLEAQKAEHAVRAQNFGQRSQQLDSIYAQNRALYQDDLASLAASKATALELADNQLRQAAATYASPIAKANAEALSAQLQASIAKFKMQADAQAEERRHHRALEASAGAKGNPTEQKDLRTAEANAQDSLDLIRTIRGSLGRTQSMVPGVTAVKQNYGEEAPNIETATTQLTLKLKDMAKLGQISVSDSALLDKLIGDPQAVWGKGSSETSKQDRLKALEAIVLRSIQNQRRATAGAQAR